MGSLTGKLFESYGRTPGLDAGLALRAVRRRVVVKWRIFKLSLGGVLGVSGFFDEEASM